jgi:hypothetical protein
MKVYLFGNETYTKIGVAKNTETRAKTLDSPMLPFSTSILAEFDAEIYAYDLEKALHHTFNARHLRGEWFAAISADSFLEKAKAIHNKLLKGEPVFPPKIDLDRVWIEEWLFGQRMLEFCNELERRNAQNNIAKQNQRQPIQR